MSAGILVDQELLYSWKEIAAYLHHGVRTVQRWERTEGLPVHRHHHSQRDSVYAYASEVDAWWRNRAARFSGGRGLDTAHARRGHGLTWLCLAAVVLLAGLVWYALTLKQ